MRNNLRIWVVVITMLFSCGQKSIVKADMISTVSDLMDSTTNENSQRSIIPVLDKYIYTDTTYKFSNGKEITIQNSYPKGGMIEPTGKQFFDSSGKRYACAVFWTRITNETTTPVELKINFPSDSFAIFTQPDSYLKLFLPKDSVSVDKLSQFNYGITGLESYLNANFNYTTKLLKKLDPNKQHIFYVVALSYKAVGNPRGALFLKEQDLYYRMSLEPYSSGVIHCGKIDFKE